MFGKYLTLFASKAYSSRTGAADFSVAGSTEENGNLGSARWSSHTHGDIGVLVCLSKEAGMLKLSRTVVDSLVHDDDMRALQSRSELQDSI